jgi:hypothetical protein
MDTLTAVLEITVLIAGISLWIFGKQQRKNLGKGMILASLILAAPAIMEGYEEGFKKGFEAYKIGFNEDESKQ